jgi:O-methyltransferase involved in polyketide biosynthesis
MLNSSKNKEKYENMRAKLEYFGDNYKELIKWLKKLKFL